MKKIQVTQDDIDNSLKTFVKLDSGENMFKAHACPIALAVKRTFEDKLENTPFNPVEVEEDKLYFNWCKTVLSRSAQRFVKKFDAEQPVKPFTFILNDDQLEDLGLK